jgi:predicted component of type VI protein secretion system
MAAAAIALVGEWKVMKRLAFAFAGAAALTLAGCNSSNQDQVNNAEMNQPSAEDLNQLSSDAANDAANAEAAALGAQQQDLANQSTDNAVNPTDAQEQNVSGM